MQNIPEQIARNKRASAFYVALLAMLLTLMGAVIAGYYDPDSWMIGAALAGMAGIISAIVARYAGPGIILRMSGAHEPDGLSGQILENVAEEMAIAAGIPKPRVLVIDDSAPNAFATGPDPEHAVVVFSTGIIEKLNREELQGVMAHEISHIRNYDIRLMTTLAMVAGLIPLLADWMRRMLWYGGGRSRSRDKDNGQLQIVFLVLVIVLSIIAPILSKLLELAVSRQREYLADASAAELTRYPEGLASALEKIALDREPLEVANRATQHLYIINPLHPEQRSLTSVFSTHPPTDERIRRLRGIEVLESEGNLDSGY